MERGVFIVEDRRGGDELRLEVEEPLGVLRKIIYSTRRADSSFRFLGGAVGYVSYDSVRYWERLPKTSRRVLEFPDMEFGLYDKGIIIDHRMGETYAFAMEGEGVELATLNGGFRDESWFKAGEARCNLTQEEFEDMVRRAKEYIASGDVFQVVLSKRYDVNLEGDVSTFYERLKRINPSPYMYLLRFGDKTIAGSSPEMLFRVESGRVETFPIAGTRPRVGGEEDDRVAANLREDPKEVAEHVMLVDLARNDVGRVCRFGTVRVDSFMEVHRFSHVQHLVSHVSGELKLGLDCLDVLKAMFPAGTVSGAPKVRAMEIIEELEPDGRGPYAGCVGYFSFNGSADFAITIRTLISRGLERGRASLQVGAGIVADSVPANEWMETEYKARSLFAALRGDPS